MHDLHVWAITSGKNSLTAHLVTEDGGNQQQVLQAASEMLEERFGLTHTTVQVEAYADCRHDAGCALDREEAHAGHDHAH